MGKVNEELDLIFDKSSAGTLEGIHDAGIETFAGNRLGGLAREQGQNSLDARLPGSKAPVLIRYELFTLKAKDFPGHQRLLEEVSAIREYWAPKVTPEDTTLSILDQAVRLLQSDSIPMLRISDRNTTGLTGSDKDDTGNWVGITKGSGVSAKSKGTGGSFGIGKNAFWANAKLRTVFFSTRDCEGKFAFQGVSKLAGRKNAEGDMHRATAYFGNPKGCSPVCNEQSILKTFVPDGVGTDVFIAGFEAGGDWEQELVAAFAENFFVAFNQGKLEALISDRRLAADSIAHTISELYEANPKQYRKLRDYYDALTLDEATVAHTNIESIGAVELRLLVRDGSAKRVMMCRGTGMSITEMMHFRTPMQFVGVLQCNDPDGNEFLRRLEPPSHDKWEAERHPVDAAGARRALMKLYSWIRSEVAKLTPIDVTVELDVPDLGQLLPDDAEPEFDASEENGEGDLIAKHDEELEGRTKDTISEPKMEIEYDDGEPIEGGSADGDEGVGDTHDTSTEHSGDGDASDSSSGGSTPVTEVTGIPSRVFHVPGTLSTYRLAVTLPKPGIYAVSLSTVGDDAKVAPVKPSNARVPRDGGSTPLVVSNDGRVTLPSQTKAGAVVVEFDLTSIVPVSLRVRVFLHD